MKKILPSFLALGVALLFMSFINPIKTVNVQVDTNASSVVWVGSKITKSHEGTIKVKTGVLSFEEGFLTAGTFVMDMTTIKCTDLSGGGAAKLDGHLSSDDFFAVAKYPTAEFIITEATASGDQPGVFTLMGDMTIKGITKPVAFDAAITPDLKSAIASIKINRTDFDIKYGSGSFFDDLGDKAIYDEFELKVNLVLK